MEPQSDSRKKIIAGLAVLIVIVVIVAAVNLGRQDESTDNTPTSQTTTDTSSQDSASEADPSATFKDGSYTATGGYNSPGGSQKITINVTLQNGVITETSAESGATDTEAEEYQDDFIANYKDRVVGKKINEIDLSRVAGSSLTPIGFNNALDQIEDQAKA